MIDENGRQTITNDGATVMKVSAYLLRSVPTAMLTQLSAPRHRPPRCPNPCRYCQVTRCRGWRWNHIGRCPGWGNLKGSQRTCRARCQFTSHHQGSTESVYDGCQQDQGDCCKNRRVGPTRDAWQAGRNSDDE